MLEIPVAYRMVPVLDSEMHLWDVGSGTPVLFLNGNPTSGTCGATCSVNAVLFTGASRRI